MTEPDYRGSLEETLRDFLKTCMTLTAATDVFHGEPRPVLKALFEALLPIEHPKFPLSSGILVARFEGAYSRKAQWSDALQRGLLLFNDAQAFSQASAAILAEEGKALEAYPANTPEMVQRQLSQKQAHDEKLLAFFLKKRGIAARPFAQLEQPARKEYFWLWSQSGFAVKRRFYRDSRAAILASAYSAPEFAR